MTLDEVYLKAEEQGIEVDEMKMRALKAISCPEGYIAIDPRRFRTSAELKTAIAHEMGHIDAGAFYSPDAPKDEKARCEYKADKRAAYMLIPPEALKKAYRAGCTEIWQLSEELDIPAPFVERAVYIYQCKEAG